MRALRTLSIVGLVASVIVGCGGEGFSAAPVSGVVTLNGKPLSKARILFQPIGKGNPGPASAGTSDDEGRFSLEFADAKKGAVIGKHKVVVTTRRFAPRSDNPDAEEEVAEEQVPDAYKTEPYTFEVPRGGTDAAKIDLNGPPPSKGGATQDRND